MIKQQFNENMGLIISYYRKTKKLNQRQLAEIVGISKQRQSRIETGKTKIEAYIVLKYAIFFGISLGTLYDRQNDAR